MMRVPAMPPSSESDPLLTDRRWRSAVLWTIRDLKGSVARRRTLSLPNLCRLFDRRWQETQPAGDLVNRGRAIGRAFLRHYYIMRQPFRPSGTPAHNGHCGG